MDKRRNKRVVLMAGLLFLILAAASVICVQMAGSIEENYQEKLGRLIMMDGERESQYVSVFQGKGSYDREESLRIGQQAEEKYGYIGLKQKSFRTVNRWISGLAGFLAVVGAGGTLLICKLRRTKSEEDVKIFELSDRVEQLQGEIELLKLQKKREESETKSLVTDISHQLKTPLASLKMCYEIAETGSFTPEEQKSFIWQGINEVRKLENLTESLIQLSRLEARMIQIKPEIRSLKKTILAAVSSVYMKALEKGITISAEEFADEEVPHDPKWTQEALVNVLDNAVKYSPSGSNIEIRVMPMVSYYSIEVEDEGIGIEKEDVNHIFQRFYRGHSSRVQEVEGSGVGLYLTRKILEEQGGSIRVKKGRRGSVFQMTVPKAVYSS